MDSATVNKALGLLMSNPELTVILFVAVVGTATVAWFIRGALEKGRIEALRESLSLAASPTKDTNEKLTAARAEQARVEKLIEADTPRLSLIASSEFSKRLIDQASASSAAALHTLTISSDDYPRR